jgi:hypothetical protein
MASLVACLVLATFFRLSSQCPDGWRQSAINSNKCFLVVVQRKMWFEAEMFCEAAAPNAYLTSIASAYETFNINGMVNDQELLVLLSAPFLTIVVRYIKRQCLLSFNNITLSKNEAVLLVAQIQS